jgi:tetratricopeptide (TPR) repeat protein
LTLAETGNIPGAEGLLVDLYMGLGREQSARLQLPAAEASFRQAYEHARRREGQASIQTLNAAVELGQHLCTYSQCLAAVELLRPAAAAAHQRIARGDHTWVPILAVAWHGAAQVRSGFLEAGMDELSSVLNDPAVLTALPPPVHAYLLVLAAESSILLGDVSTAAAQLDHAEAVNASQGAADPNVEINVLNARLAVAMAMRDVSAITRLVTTLELERPKAGEKAERGARRQAWLAEALYARSDGAAALAAASAALDNVSASSNRTELREPECRALLVAGRVHLSGGRPAQAEPLLRRAVAVAAQTYDATTSPHVADSRVALAAALLDLGQRDEALRLADVAQAAHDRHPRLAPRFQEAVAMVRKRLSERRA